MEHCCYQPFDEIEIYNSGRVYTCCPSFFKEDYYLGNIFEVDTFDEIWYSDKAIELRKRIIQNDFSLCNTDICNKAYKDDVSYVERPPYPRNVRFSYDYTCNLKCFYCRDDRKKLHQARKWDHKINDFFIPLLSNCKLVTLSTIGEVTASVHSQNLIRKILEINPTVKFDILTNGLLFNEFFVDKLNLEDRLEQVIVTFSAAREETYNKILRGSNFQTVKKNIDYISQLKKSGKLPNFGLGFVVSSINYKELPEFFEFAFSKNAFPMIWEFRNKEDSKYFNEFYKYTVWDKHNPDYNKFVQVIKNIRSKYNEKDYKMTDLFKNLEPISMNESILYKISSIFGKKF